MSDRWSASGSNILELSQLEIVRRHLEEVGHIAVKHWHYRLGASPTPVAFSNYEDFERYLRSQTSPGDAIDIWAFPDDVGSRIAEGKIPDQSGKTPESGSY